MDSSRPLSNARKLSRAVAVATVLFATIERARAAKQDEHAPDARPNVVLIVADDLDAGITLDTRRPDTGELAYPNLRSIGERGVVFTNAFVSHPLCTPSRATILTGQYDQNHGVVANEAKESAPKRLERAPTLAGWLQASGYTTMLVGKYVNDYSDTPLADGRAMVPSGWTHWFATARLSSYVEWHAVRDGVIEDHTGTKKEYLTDALGREAVRAIGEAKSASKPFFLMLTFFAPHDSQDGVTPAPLPAQRHAGAFQEFQPTWPPSFDEADVSDKPESIARLSRLDSSIKLGITRRMRARRETMLAVDEAVGALFKALAENGMTERTVVIFTSDNGFEHGEHRLLIGKERPYEESIRVPLVACGPGIPAGAKCDEIVLNLDLAPTIAELAQTKPQREVDGRSWLALLRDPKTEWRHDFLVTGMRAPPFVGVRTKTRLYIEYDKELDGKVDERELYWLAADERNKDADPFELTNLAGDERFKDVIEAMHARVEQLRKCNGASCW